MSKLEKVTTPQKMGRKIGGDSFFRIILALAAAAIIGLMVALAGELTSKSSVTLVKLGLSFLWITEWNPGANVFGSVIFVYGTLLTSGLSLLLAVPVSIGVAVFLTEKIHHLKSLSNLIGTLVELLAAVPSVIFGLWGLYILSPFIRDYVERPLYHYASFLPIFDCTPFGLDYFMGGLILAIMIIPTVTAITRDVLNAVPNSQREALYALGATKWEVIRGSVLPYARSGIFGATILGLGRAVGETMAVTMVIGNQPQISGCLFSGGYTLASLLANQFFEAQGGIQISALIEIALVLFLLALVINVAARLLIWRMRKGVRF